MAGYEPDFTGDGVRVELPTLSSTLQCSVLKRPAVFREARFLGHTHYTAVMKKYSRQFIYFAQTIDQSNFVREVPGDGTRGWRFHGGVGYGYGNLAGSIEQR